MTHTVRPAGVAAAAVLTFALMAGCTGGSEEGVLRLGYFPNLTHAQALYGASTGLYQRHLGNTTLELQTFNAGPAAFETLLSGRVDVVYVGPSPTINTIDRQGLGVVVIIAGAASGGAFFVVTGGIDDPQDLRGKRVATPQLGNTQDVALKHYLLENGLKRRDQGGDVEVINAQNHDILTYFQNGNIDGAWVPEPWASRLLLEAGGKVFLDEADLWEDGQYVTTHLVTTRKFLQERPADIAALLAAHAEATHKLAEGGPDVLKAVNDGIEEATGKRLTTATMAAAFPNIKFTNDPLPDTFQRQYEMARDLGVVHKVPDLTQVYDLSHLPDSG